MQAFDDGTHWDISPLSREERCPSNVSWSDRRIARRRLGFHRVSACRRRAKPLSSSRLYTSPKHTQEGSFEPVVERASIAASPQDSWMPGTGDRVMMHRELFSNLQPSRHGGTHAPQGVRQIGERSPLTCLRRSAAHAQDVRSFIVIDHLGHASALCNRQALYL